MTQQEFAETIKVAPATLSSIFTGRTAPSLKIVEAIKSRFPDISTDWLMFGRGAMTDYKSEEAGSAFDHEPAGGIAGAIDFSAEGASSTTVPELGVAATMQSVVASGTQGITQQPIATAQSTGCGGKAAVGGIQMVNNCDKKERRIVEIRIFYDDQTWETFVPKK